MAPRTAEGRKLSRVATKVAVLAACGAMIALGVIGVVDPLFYSPERSAQADMLNQAGSRTVFTTYFYWYKSAGPDIGSSVHIAELWNTTAYPEKVPTVASEFPPGWPGPTHPSLMVQNSSLPQSWHDYCSYHPPADSPAYNTTGGVIESSLLNGTMQNMSTWFFWNNTLWHEWELRGMMRAGIDVLIPVYWYNRRPDSKWAYDGIVTLVDAWNDLASKVASEQSLSLAGAMARLPKIALFYDTTCVKVLWSHLTNIDFEEGEGPDLKDPVWQEHFWNSIDDFLGLMEDNSTYLWNDRYVVWMYSDSWFADVGTEVLEYCRERCIAKYGRSIYFVGPDGWYEAGADGLCNWGSCFGVVTPRGRGTIPCAAVSPGYYNLGAIAGQTPLFKARDFSRYQDEWRQVMDLGAAWVHVETWNELHEGTNIAWAQEYGWDWIDATRAMTDEFHAMTGYNVRDKVAWPGVYATIAAMVTLLAFAAITSFLRRL